MTAMLKLNRLPDRQKVKLSLSIEPELFADLERYAEIYAETYGERETVKTLAPFILRAFIDSDAKFKRIQKQRSTGDASAPKQRSASSGASKKET